MNEQERCEEKKRLLQDVKVLDLIDRAKGAGWDHGFDSIEYNFALCDAFKELCKVENEISRRFLNEEFIRIIGRKGIERILELQEIGRKYLTQQ